MSFLKTLFSLHWLKRWYDPAGFIDRQLFDFPPERGMYLDDLKVPVPEDIPDLEKVLKVRYGTLSYLNPI